MKFKVPYENKLDLEVTGFVYQNDSTAYVLVDFDCGQVIGAYKAIIRQMNLHIPGYAFSGIYPQDDYVAQIHITAKDGSALSLVDIEDLSNDYDLPIIHDNVAFGVTV